MKRLQFAPGTRFGRLAVIAPAPVRDEETYFLCRCDCGQERSIRGADLRSGNTQSCGCLKMERIRAAAAKKRARGRLADVPEYKVWMSMRARCKNPNEPAFADYGGRGIRVCPEWDASFKTFLAHIGRRPSGRHSIDRIDNNGNYEPGNVRWATQDIQNGNKRTTTPLTFGGETLPLNVWAKRIGMLQCVLRGRILRGWSAERALTTPARGYRHSEILESSKSRS